MEISTLSLIWIATYFLGFLFAILALWRARTAQGATAWVVALIGFPVISIPLFLIFGRNKFYGYVRNRKNLENEALRQTTEIRKFFNEQKSLTSVLKELTVLASKANQPGFTTSNELELLVNAEATYKSMFEAIEKAKEYILFQFYIYREDDIGNKFKQALIKKVAQGVKVYFLYDGIGSRISKSFTREMQKAGVKIFGFESTKKWPSQWQINFRNHRKIVVVDGHEAFIGGINVGDEYLGKSDFGPWRDTHVKICGPAAAAAQISFIKDWYWVTGKALKLTWVDPTPGHGADVLVLHTGPSDEGDVCSLAHLAIVTSAKKRIWISNPYFIPPDSLSDALALAALRGVDIRIIIPSYGDNLLVQYASYPHVEKLLRVGVKFMKYTAGFPHQKVMLIDDDIGVVGSTNFDARSFFINFEIMAISDDANFIKNIEDMLKNDFLQSKDLTIHFFDNLPRWKQLATRAARLFAPML